MEFSETDVFLSKESFHGSSLQYMQKHGAPTVLGLKVSFSLETSILKICALIILRHALDKRDRNYLSTCSLSENSLIHFISLLCVALLAGEQGFLAWKVLQCRPLTHCTVLHDWAVKYQAVVGNWECVEIPREGGSAHGQDINESSLLINNPINPGRYMMIILRCEPIKTLLTVSLKE